MSMHKFSVLTPSMYFQKIAILTAVLAVNPFYVLAQEVEEVVVQAEKSDSAPIEEGVSVAVLDGEKLADAGIENVEDVAAYVPNLVLSETSTGTNIVIRGIGAGVNQGFDQSVGLYIDHVPLPRGQMARAPFLDLGGVQVLRGPQYVRDGNYSIAGSVHMLTNEAKDEFELALDFTNVPSQNDRKLLLTASIPISDWWSSRLAYQIQQADGYVKNVARDEDGPQRDDTLLRLVNTFNITADFKAKLKIERGSFDRVGRQIEIIDAQETPDFREFPNYRGADGLQDPREARGILSVNEGVLLPEYRSELDFVLRPIQSLYDAVYGGLDGTGTPAYAGRSYLEVLNDMYLGALGGEEIDNLNGVAFSNGAVTPPAGLLDSTLDFRRAANEEEASQNTSTNITLNLEYNLGASLLRLIASDVEYDYTETIDTDFTPVPILLTEQEETYEQQFYRFDFDSPPDYAVRIRAGASFLKSELKFDEVIRTRVGGPTNQAETDAFFAAGVTDQAVYTTFNPEITVDQGAPFLPYFGRYVTGLARSLQVFEPNREFRQDAETRAAFVDFTVDVNERFNVILGARYTYAEKAAVRDFAFLLRDGTTYVVPETVPGGAQFAAAEDNVTASLGSIFNFAEHTDKQIISNRITRPFNTIRCGEVQSFALGGPCDDDALPGGPNAPIRDEKFLPSLTLNFQATPDLLTFFSFRQANKIGGFDARSVAPPTVLGGRGLAPGTFRFEDEDATTFELGAQWYFPNGAGLMNATFFYTDFKNLQVSTADRSVGFNVRNAGEAISQGIEIEGNYQPTDSFGVNYSFAWIDFEFKEFPFGACTLYERPDSFLITAEDISLNAVLPLGTVVPIIYERSLPNPDAAGFNPVTGYGPSYFSPETVLPEVPDGGPSFFAIQSFDNRTLSVLPTFCDFEGKTNQYVAEYQGTFSFNFQRPISDIGIFKSSLDVIYNSGYETTTTQESAVAQGEYSQFNGRLALASSEEVWEIALQGENLTNEKIVGFANEVPIGSRTQGARTHFGFVRPPRSYGLNFRYKFY